MKIVLTKEQTKKMLNVKNLLTDMFDNGNLHGLTPYCVRDMANCYNEIVQSIEHYGMTMCDDVAQMFQKYGFRVETVETDNTIPHWHIHILSKKQEDKIHNRRTDIIKDLDELFELASWKEEYLQNNIYSLCLGDFVDIDGDEFSFEFEYRITEELFVFAMLYGEDTVFYGVNEKQSNFFEKHLSKEIMEEVKNYIQMKIHANN